MSNSRANHDLKEIGKFDREAQEWWDPLGNLRTLHQINPLRLSVIHQHTTISNATILDVGCGGGILSESLAKEGGIVTALDLSPSLIEIARQHASQIGVTVDYQQSAVENWQKEQKNLYDVVTCMEMLEHVPEPAQIIESCCALLKPGGKLFLSTLNRTFSAWLKAIVAAEYLLKMLPQGTHKHNTFIRPSELARWCRRYNLRFEAIYGIDYEPFQQQFALSKKVDVNYIAVFSKPAEEDS